MIEIIIEKVEMPEFSKRKFQIQSIKGQWQVIDTETNNITYKAGYEEVILACHNLNKKHYQILVYPEKNRVIEILTELRKYRDTYEYGSKERMEYNSVCDKLDCLVSHLLNGF